MQITWSKYFECHWLNKDKYNFGKLNLTRFWILVTIYAKGYKGLVLVTIYPSLNKQNTNLPIQRP